MSARLRFAAVLRAPHVSRLLWTALLARAPTGINGLALVLFVRAQTGSYAVAGLVAGAYAAGAAGVAPLLGRVVDRRGAASVLMPLAIVHGVFLGLVVGLGLAGAAAGLLVACAFLSGSAIPPLGSVLRALWPSLMGSRKELLPAAYALDAVVIEVTFVAGPLLVGLAAAYGSPQLALIAAVVLVIAGTAAFSAQAPVRGYAPHESDEADDTGGRLGALHSPGVRTIVVTLVPMGFCFGAAEVAFPAFGEAEGNRALAGPLIAIWSAGSAVGGLVYGAHGHRIAVRRVGGGEGNGQGHHDRESPPAGPRRERDEAGNQEDHRGNGAGRQVGLRHFRDPVPRPQRIAGHPDREGEHHDGGERDETACALERQIDDLLNPEDPLRPHGDRRQREGEEDGPEHGE